MCAFLISPLAPFIIAMKFLNITRGWDEGISILSAKALSSHAGGLFLYSLNLPLFASYTTSDNLPDMKNL